MGEDGALRMAKATIANPGSYSGQKIGDLRHGWGRYDYPGGVYSYEGEWFEGQKHGDGTLRFADHGNFLECGSEYEGQFLQGEIVGHGTRRWKDGSFYSGQWVEGEKEGSGEYTSADGAKYEGEFHNNRFHG